MTNENQGQDNSQKSITDIVGQKIGELQNDGLKIPENYNYQNALKSAFFALNEVKTSKDDGYRPALQACTTKSVANTLLDMVVQGLSPAKTQCYFIVYHNFKDKTFELQMQRSYFGTQAVVKRLGNVKNIWAEAIHEGDKFEIGSEDSRIIVKTFEPYFENMDNQIIGAYAVVETNDNEKVYTIMTKKQIDQSWSKAKTKNVQNSFPEEMAKRTVINRAAKNFINTSDDSDLYVDAIGRTTTNEFDDNKEIKDVTPHQEPAKSINELTEEPADPKQPVKDVTPTDTKDSMSDEEARKAYDEIKNGGIDDDADTTEDSEQPDGQTDLFK